MDGNKCIMCGSIIPEGLQVCENCYHKVKTKKDKRKEFLNALCDIEEYWQDKPEPINGVIFSILVMFDGCSSLNDFERLEIKGISNRNELHDDYCKIRNKRKENT